MKEIAVITIGDTDAEATLTLLDQKVHVRLFACGGDVEKAKALIAEVDGKVDCIALDGLPAQLQLGATTRPHKLGAQLVGEAKLTPLVDGSGIRGGIERWAVILADRAQPGIFAEKRVLLAPGLNHSGLAQALVRHTEKVRYADPIIYFGLPYLPLVGSKQTLEQTAAPTLERLDDAPFRRLRPEAGTPHHERSDDPFLWADVIAGDIGAIRRYAPQQLKRKTIIAECATQEDVDDLRQRGVSILVTLMPSLDGTNDLGQWPAAVVEAVLVALRRDESMPLSEDTYLDLMADIHWTPGIRYLQPDEAGINKFSFVIHPLNVSFIHKHPIFRWTKYLPDDLVEWTAAYMPPMYVSRITGGKSPTTGQRIEGYLYTLGATPRQMMKHDASFSYGQINQVARMAERKGARILGLGAFTSVVGDAGITIAHESDIAITSGNSLTVAMTLEAAKKAVQLMGATDLSKGKAMIVGATGSIASVCSRLIAQAIGNVVLVSIEPEKLLELKRTIQRETPGAEVTIATKAGDLISDCDLVITATSAFGQRVIDITKCKLGAVICDGARPPDINPKEAALRPDVLVIESGEVLIPGDIDFGYDIGLPPKTSYACLAETALLAMDGRFEDYTLGRNITMERVKEIYKLSLKHDFQLAGLRSFEQYITDEDLAQKRALADQYRADPELFARARAEAQRKLQDIPVMAKGVKASGSFDKRWITVGAIGAGAVAGLLALGRVGKSKGK
ncbi:MAG: serine carboxypeptidase [Anaerolineales bacterium]|nr:serine carboxypeptidase [Anaerolineales bacterium]